MNVSSLEQYPLHVEANEEPSVETEDALKKLETPALRKRYQESTGKDSSYRFHMATEDVLRAILIEGILNKDAALDRLRAIDSDHPTADRAIEWTW